ncbi:MAG: helix-turn-helix domain-containing protein [Terricaulis sp.]
MRWQDLDQENCSLARALAVVGDRWTLLVLREAFLRVRRFDDFQSRLGIARRVLAERLAHLVESGVLAKVAYHEAPQRFEYRLTKRGLDLYPVLIGLVHWGDQHFAGKKGPPLLHRHLSCGHDFRAVLTCSECCDVVDPRDVEPHAGPGARRKAG